MTSLLELNFINYTKKNKDKNSKEDDILWEIQPPPENTWVEIFEPESESMDRYESSKICYHEIKKENELQEKEKENKNNNIINNKNKKISAAKIKVSSIKAKTNNKINSHKNRYSFDLNKTFSSSTTYTNFMAKQESIREKKNFLEKIQYLRNHIKALKKHQSEIAKKEEKIKEKESYKNTMKKKNCIQNK